MEVLFDRGLHLPALDLWMDSLRGRQNCWVSHGHADHIAGHKRFLATGPTAAFLRLRYKRSVAVEVPYGQPVEAEGYRVTLYPAGHCLGAAQMLIELESGHRIVYTGDFKLRTNPTAEPCPILPCDTLIMETTYGNPRYVFPPEDEVFDRIAEYLDACLGAGDTPVVLGYSLGKAQEVLHWLLSRGYAVRYHPFVEPGVMTYQQWGVRFEGDCARLTEGPAPGCVIVAPPGPKAALLYRLQPRVRTVFLSGWALDGGSLSRFRTDAAFPLSDHADYPDLLRYALESGASTVYTVNGQAHLASHLRTLSVTARHLSQVARPVQLSLQI